MAAGGKVGHGFEDHCLAHMRPLFCPYETLSERYDGLRAANMLLFLPSDSTE